MMTCSHLHKVVCHNLLCKLTAPSLHIKHLVQVDDVTPVLDRLVVIEDLGEQILEVSLKQRMSCVVVGLYTVFSGQ